MIYDLTKNDACTMPLRTSIHLDIKRCMGLFSEVMVPGVSNSGITRMPRTLASSMISAMTSCVYTWVTGSYAPWHTRSHVLSRHYPTASMIWSYKASKTAALKITGAVPWPAGNTESTEGPRSGSAT